MSYNVYALDFETTPFKELKYDYELRERFVNLVKLDDYSRYHFNFEKNEQEKFKKFLRDLCLKDRKTIIYCHNNKFDYAFLTRYLPNLYDRKVINRGSSIIAVEIYREYKKKYKGKYKTYHKTILSVRDSFALFPASLESIGNGLGYPKLKQDYSAEITKEYIEYCYVDCEIVLKALVYNKELIYEMFGMNLHLNRLPYTLPSLGKKIEHFLITNEYGKQFINKMYDIDIDFENWLRESGFYCGGRVGVYNFNECDNGQYNDYNSHYGNPMFNDVFPIPPYREYDCSNSDKCFLDFKGNPFIFACLCEVIEYSSIPIVPFKTEKGKLLFPNGKKTFFLFRKEIEFLLETHQKVKILKVFTCSEYKPIFRTFIGKFYEYKKNSKGFKLFMAKRLLVSIYGKYAEKREKEHLTEVREITRLSEIELQNVRIIYAETENDIISNDYIEREINTELKYLRRELKVSEILKTNIIYSMMITAHCRLILAKDLLKNYDDKYLSDTDSFVSQNDAEYGNELGQLKKEFTFRRFQALGAKEYVYSFLQVSRFPLLPLITNQVVYKMKGFPKKKRYENINQFIIDYLEPKELNRMIGYLEHYKREKDLRTVIYQVKQKHSFYDKRWINDDLTTRPFHLQNDNFNELIVNNAKKIMEIIHKYESELKNKKLNELV